MKALVWSSALVAAVLIWVQFPMWNEVPTDQADATTDTLGVPAPVELESTFTGSSAAVGSTLVETDEAAAAGVMVPSGEQRFEEALVYKGEVIILGDPSDPEENMEGVDTYTGQRFILGEPSDPNEADDGLPSFSADPIQLGEYADPNAPSDPEEQSSVTPTELGEYEDPEAQFFFPSELKEVQLGEASEPDDP